MIATNNRMFEQLDEIGVFSWTNLTHCRFKFNLLHLEIFALYAQFCLS